MTASASGIPFPGASQSGCRSFRYSVPAASPPSWGPRDRAPCSNGLGQRIGWQYDTDADGTVETTGTDDPWTYALYNERWQLIGEHTADDGTVGAGAADDPDKLFVHHGAGLGGRGSSSYIDDIIMADHDTNDDGVLEERTYYVQNWRHDVVALTEPDGDLLEVTDYTLYGETIDVLVGDLDRDGDVDSTDTTAFNIAEPTADCGAGGCPSDFDRDNDVDGDDAAFITAEYGDEYRDTVGVALNARAHGRGFAGYKADNTMPIYHVRHRAYRPDLGKWTKRDPAGYADGGNVYAYARGNAVKNVDAMGLCAGCGAVSMSDAYYMVRRSSGTYADSKPRSATPYASNWWEPIWRPIDEWWRDNEPLFEFYLCIEKCKSDFLEETTECTQQFIRDTYRCRYELYPVEDDDTVPGNAANREECLLDAEVRHLVCYIIPIEVLPVCYTTCFEIWQPALPGPPSKYPRYFPVPKDPFNPVPSLDPP